MAVYARPLCSSNRPMKTDRTPDNELSAAVPANVGILLGALRLKNPQAGAWHELSTADWEDLLLFCLWANLLLPLAQLPKDGFPSWVTERLEKYLTDNSSRFERVKETYREAARVLHSAAIEHVVLKGFAQYPGYVRSPRLRSQGDIDIYCPPDLIHQASEELQSLGYSPDTNQYYGRTDHLPTLIRKTNWVWRGNPFDPDMPLALELHFCFWNKDTSYFDVEGVQNFWQRRITRQAEDLSFTGLDEYDNLGYTALHALRNILAGVWVVHHLYELASFLHDRAADEEFWQRWTKLHDDSLRSLEAIPFALAVSWFGCDIPPQVQAEFARFHPAIQSWLANFSASPLATMFIPNKDRVWLHMSLIDSPREKLALLWRALIPRRIPGAREPGTYNAFRRAQSRVTQPQVKYLLYVLSRVIFHARMIPATLWRGLKWWRSQKMSAPAK
jgi:hypothetical protein